MANPVGTGPYRLKQWMRSSKIVLEANPDYRGFTWDFKSDDPDDQPLIAQMKGKKMPQVGRIEVSIIEEDQARLLAFQNGELDLMDLGGAARAQRARRRQAQAGIRQEGHPAVADRRPVDGLRVLEHAGSDRRRPHEGEDRAAPRDGDGLQRRRRDQRHPQRAGGRRCEYPIPPGVVGHDPNYRSPVRYDPALANQLLDSFGYKKGADGWRNLPDGKPFTIRYASRPDSLGRQLDELWKKALDSIGVRMEVQKDKFPELLKLERQCKLMMRTASWIADYPDADNFMQLLYGKNIGQNNNGCAKIPEYDKLYEQSIRMPDSPERNRIYHDMARIIEVYAPWRLDTATLPQHADPAARAGLQEASDPACRVGVRRRGKAARQRAERRRRQGRPGLNTTVFARDPRRGRRPHGCLYRKTPVADDADDARRHPARVLPVQLGRRRSRLRAGGQDQQPGADRQHPPPARRRPALLGPAVDLHQAGRHRRFRRELEHERARVEHPDDAPRPVADRCRAAA